MSILNSQRMPGAEPLTQLKCRSAAVFGDAKSDLRPGRSDEHTVDSAGLWLRRQCRVESLSCELLPFVMSKCLALASQLTERIDTLLWHSILYRECSVSRFIIPWRVAFHS
jgi:hypothetical protein